MNLFELFVKIGVDDQASGKLKDLGGKLGNGLKTAAKIGTAAVGAAAAGIAALTTQAIKSFAEYEQLAGGAQKIFDQMDYSKIATDANNAYKELGLSANQYLAVINDVGATFAATMGDEAGYEAAKTGLKAISDYASGTGKNVDELSQKFTLITRSTSSYQSIADQFSGILPATSAGFLEQAQAVGILSDKYTQLTQVPIDEYQAAVSQMLQQGVAYLGLANNTVNEAFSTLSGSLNMTKSAWANLITGIADGNADLGSLVNNLVESVSAVGSNMLHVIDTALNGIVDLIENLAPKIVEKLPSLLESVLPNLIGAAVSLLEAAATTIPQLLPVIFETALPKLANGIVTVFSKLTSVLPSVIESIASYLPSTVSLLLSGVTSLIKSLASALPKAIKPIVKAMPDLIEEISKSLGENLPIILESLLDLATELLPLLTEASTVLMDFMPQLLESFFSELAKHPEILESIGNLLLELVKFAIHTLTSPSSPMGMLYTVLFSLVDSLFGVDLKEKLEMLMDDNFAVVVDAFENVVEFFRELPTKITEFLDNVKQGIIDWKDNLKEKITEFVTDLIDKFEEKIADFKDIGKNIVAGIKNGISEAWTDLKTWFTNLFGDLIGIAKKILGIASPSKVFKKIGGFTAEGFGAGFEDEFARVKDDMEDALNFDDASVGINASIRKVGAGAAGGAFGGTSIGNININIDGAKYSDEQSLATAVAEALQNMTDRKVAVYA